MEHRTCAVCDREFEGHHNAVCCPPTDRDRAAQKTPRSWCARRRQRHLERGTPLKGQPPVSFTCVQCHADVEPSTGLTERRFCSEACKKVWHKEQVELPKRLLDSIAASATPHKDAVAYRRAMRLDPCCYCGEPTTQLDHIEPKSQGGSDEWDNRAGTCASCNGRKQDMPMLLWMGWKLQSDQFQQWNDARKAILTRVAA